MPPTTTETKLRKARSQMILSQRFWGSLALRLSLAERADIDTCATDGTSLYYNPAFVDDLPPAELAGVVAHEVAHCALLHHTRRGDRDPARWNVACDYAINPMIVDAGFTLPSGMLLDEQYRGLSAEQIYGMLSPPPQPPEEGDDGEGEGDDDGGENADDGDDGGQDDGADSDGDTSDDGADGDGQPAAPDPGGCGGVMDAPVSTPADLAREQREWQIAAAQAERAALSCGQGTGGMDRALEEQRHPLADWRSLLWQFMNTLARDDYAWTPPNRRHVANGLYLPSLRSERLGPIVIGVDTSGSIDHATLEQFASEISAIAAETQPEALHIVYCDWEVSDEHVQTFMPGEEVEIKPHGGGGTAFDPVFEWVEREDIAPACLIYLTDLLCSSHPPEPGYPTLWGAIGTHWLGHELYRPPFGEIIQL